MHCAKHLATKSFLCVLQHKARERQAIMAHACAADETTWRRRACKRLAAVSAVKATRDYMTCRSRPPTPDPFDRTVTKRCWERSIQNFRRVLRAQAPQTPLEWLEGAETETIENFYDFENLQNVKKIGK